MEYQDEVLCFTGAAVINIASVPQKEHLYDAIGGPFTRFKVNKYLELYVEDGIIDVYPCSGIMEFTIPPLIPTGEKKTFGRWIHKIYWACGNSGFDGETTAEVGRLEYILIDIPAKQIQTPFHRFLGAVRDSVTMYDNRGSTHLSGRVLAVKMKRSLECGYRTVKMKVETEFGTRLDYDVEWAELVRATIGSDVSLAIDGGHVFSPEGARRFVDRVEAHNVTWFGESIHAYDFTGYYELTRDLPMIMAAGELMRDHYLLEPYLGAGVRHFQPMSSTLSGVKERVMVRDMAADNRLDFSPGGLPLFACSLMAIAGEDAMEELLEVCSQPVLDCMEVTIGSRNGRFHIPNLPGLPFRLDVEWLRRKEFLLFHMLYRAL